MRGLSIYFPNKILKLFLFSPFHVYKLNNSSLCARKKCLAFPIIVYVYSLRMVIERGIWTIYRLAWPLTVKWYGKFISTANGINAETKRRERGVQTCSSSDIQLVIQKVASGDFVRKSTKILELVSPYLSFRMCQNRWTNVQEGRKNSFY